MNYGATKKKGGHVDRLGVCCRDIEQQHPARHQIGFVGKGKARSALKPEGGRRIKGGLASPLGGDPRDERKNFQRQGGGASEGTRGRPKLSNHGSGTGCILPINGGKKKEERHPLIGEKEDTEPT